MCIDDFKKRAPISEARNIPDLELWDVKTIDNINVLVAATTDTLDKCDMIFSYVIANPDAYSEKTEVIILK